MSTDMNDREALEVGYWARCAERLESVMFDARVHNLSDQIIYDLVSAAALCREKLAALDAPRDVAIGSSTSQGSAMQVAPVTEPVTVQLDRLGEWFDDPNESPPVTFDLAGGRLISPGHLLRLLRDALRAAQLKGGEATASQDGQDVPERLGAATGPRPAEAASIRAFHPDEAALREAEKQWRSDPLRNALFGLLHDSDAWEQDTTTDVEEALRLCHVHGLRPVVTEAQVREALVAEKTDTYLLPLFNEKRVDRVIDILRELGMIGGEE
jgi:hypothetical protein